MKNDKQFLVVYNTCGLRGDNTDHYIKCLRSILTSQTTFKYKLAMSSCLNQKECRDRISQEFGDLVEIIAIDKPVTVNITYNKTCLEMISKYGPFEGYLYLDSGVDFVGNQDALEKGFKSFIDNDYGILSFQTNTDHGLHNSKGARFPILRENYIMPLGGSINGHAELFCHSIVEKYGRVWPDVFAAYCTESTFTFISASVGKKQAVLCDIVLNHAQSLDGPSSSSPHNSKVYRNHWNNLLFGRDANIFIQDKDAKRAGLGYEECNKILEHDPDAYIDGLPKDPKALSDAIMKYFFLTDQELNYEHL
jgi:hypothetical protein